MGDSAKDLLDRIPELLEQFDADVRNFEPAWRGFATSPTGTLQYADLGGLCGLLWTRHAMTGESNANTLTIENVPAEIRPPTLRRSVCYLIDAGELVMGGWQLDAHGVLTLEIMRAQDPTAPRSYLVPDAEAFTPSGRKGLSAPFAIMYPLERPTAPPTDVVH
jgi:hypothetical protein